MEQQLLNIGFGSTVVAERVVAIVSPNSAPMKRLKDEARNDNRLIDATHGRRTRSIIVLDSNHIVGNRTYLGGGMFIDDYSRPTLNNNVIARNQASSNGGGAVSAPKHLCWDHVLHMKMLLTTHSIPSPLSQG